MRAFTLCLLCVTAACGAAPPNVGFGVAVSATFDSTVTNTELAQVTQLVISATGDETYQHDEPLNRAADRAESFVYRPLDSTRRLALNIVAEDADGAVIATGSSAQIQLTAGDTSRLQITLFPQALPDAGASDMVGAAFPPCGSNTAAELCLDFESAIPSTWTQGQMNGSLTIDTAHAHSGTHALHIHVDALGNSGSGLGILSETSTFVVTPSAFHVRAFILAPTGPIASMTTFLAAQASAGMGFVLDDGHYEMYDSFGTSSTNSTETTASFPTGTWQCVEWAVTIGSPGTMTLSVNGSTFTSNEIHDTTASSPPLDHLTIGSEVNNSSTQSSPAVDLWMDDIVVAQTTIGCTD